jgi:hypothetical protein
MYDADSVAKPLKLIESCDDMYNPTKLKNDRFEFVNPKNKAALVDRLYRVAITNNLMYTKLFDNVLTEITQIPRLLNISRSYPAFFDCSTILEVVNNEVKTKTVKTIFEKTTFLTLPKQIIITNQLTSLLWMVDHQSGILAALLDQKEPDDGVEINLMEVLVDNELPTSIVLEHNVLSANAHICKHLDGIFSIR